MALRALLRVKIADDADLDQAEAAVKELRRFLRGLDDAATARRVSAIELLRGL